MINTNNGNNAICIEKLKELERNMIKTEKEKLIIMLDYINKKVKELIETDK